MHSYTLEIRNPEGRVVGTLLLSAFEVRDARARARLMAAIDDILSGDYREPMGEPEPSNTAHLTAMLDRAHRKLNAVRRALEDEPGSN